MTTPYTQKMRTVHRQSRCPVQKKTAHKVHKQDIIYLTRNNKHDTTCTHANLPTHDTHTHVPMTGHKDTRNTRAQHKSKHTNTPRNTTRHTQQNTRHTQNTKHGALHRHTHEIHNNIHTTKTNTQHAPQQTAADAHTRPHKHACPHRHTHTR